jgi:hypothetical protein
VTTDERGSSHQNRTTGVVIFVLTVDSETHSVLRTEREDLVTGERTEVDLRFESTGMRIRATAAMPGSVPR